MKRPVLRLASFLFVPFARSAKWNAASRAEGSFDLYPAEAMRRRFASSRLFCLSPAQSCLLLLFKLTAFAFIADGVGELQIGFGVAATCGAGLDVVEAGPPFFPERRMGQFEPVLGHRLPAKGTLAALPRPELSEKRRIRRGVRYGHKRLYQAHLPCVSCLDHFIG